MYIAILCIFHFDNVHILKKYWLSVILNYVTVPMYCGCETFNTMSASKTISSVYNLNIPASALCNVYNVGHVCSELRYFSLKASLH